MRALRALLFIAIVTILCPFSATAVDGVNEISQTAADAAGGFPYMITASGSYVLTSDLAVSAPLGLDVLAPNVRIDLNGFSIAGSGTGTGISAMGGGGVTIRNGTMSGFDVAIFGGGDVKVTDMKLTGNGQAIDGGNNCLIAMNQMTGNTLPGSAVVSGQNCKIENNVIEGNGNQIGLSASGSVVVHNRVGNNGSGGILCSGCTIQENVVSNNGTFGISDGTTPVLPPTVNQRNNVIGNVINRNTGPGIRFGRPALITNNTVSGHTLDGIVCGAACVLNGNTVDRNNTSDAGGSGGVTVASGSSLHANAISFNGGFGLTLPTPADVSYTDNTITGNGTPLFAGPDVISPATLTGANGNVCSGAACP